MKTGLQLLREAERRTNFISARDWDTIEFGSERRAQIEMAKANAGVNFRIAHRRVRTIRLARSGGYDAPSAIRDLDFHHGAARRQLRHARKLAAIGQGEQRRAGG